MVWFLVALLRESPPSTCCWIVPIRCELEESFEALSGSYVDDDCHATECMHSDYYVELLENEGHAKERDSGLIVLDIRPLSARSGWRSNHSSRVEVFHERRLWLD